MKLRDPQQQMPSSKLNVCYFLLPIALTMPAFFIEGSVGLLGFVGSVISAFVALFILIFRPARKVKQAAWSHLFGFAITIIIVIMGAYAVNSGQSSPWLQ